MKNPALKWLHPLLTRLTIAEKLWLIFWLPLLVLLLVVGITLANNQAQRDADDDAYLAAQVQLTASLIGADADQAGKLPAHLSLSKSGVPGKQTDGDLIRYTAQSANGQYVTGTLDLSHSSLWEHQSATLWVVLLAVVILGPLTLLLDQYMRRSIYELIHALQRLAEGDMRVRMGLPAARDEFTVVAGYLDQVAERQQRTLHRVNDSAEALEMFADEFRDAAAEGQGIAQSQRQYLDSLATAMEQMTAAIREVARNANDTSSQTRLSSEEATQGASRVNLTIESIQTLADEISHASSAVEQLTSRANKINEVVTVINAISGQTNLLALNAAIEAARAGEQGRGFAVVADEVRTLAGRTQQATVEIQKMIEELQSGTGDLNNIMEKTVVKAAESRELITTVGQDIERIASYSESVFEMSAQIATSSEEQSSVASDIAQNLEEVRSQSMQVEESTASTVAGTQNLMVTARELTQLLHGLKL
ncbi:methyl-accepting chemotaxis protein [Pseudaeromonas sp. ZJS20]|uniref:methyl-accepting chemotaxis protein n=1 Tax=Pseudaeromonas aegiceratis TaxID=3153928 RepID=UPI00390CA3A8